MENLLTGLRAIAEQTRIRLLFILSQGEFNVSELTQILDQSQPRVSRHLKLLADEGLILRHKEGNWVLFRLAEQGPAAALVHAIVKMLSPDDESLTQDMAAITAIRQQRHEQAQNYFRTNAANWQSLRSLHVDEAEVEQKILQLTGSSPLKTVIDLGTGTGRMLELLAPQAEQAIGLDNNREMIALARTKLEQQGLRQAQVRQGDIYALPFQPAQADLVVIHQVLHFLDDPLRALLEARRVLSEEGRLLIIDFAPHEMETLRDDHAHRRLGLAHEQMLNWLSRCGLDLVSFDQLDPPPQRHQTGLSVSIWQARPTPQSKAQLAS